MDFVELWGGGGGTVRSTVSRIYLKRLVKLLMQLSEEIAHILPGLIVPNWTHQFSNGHPETSVCITKIIFYIER
jgi:hypothetical protein